MRRQRAQRADGTAAHAEIPPEISLSQGRAREEAGSMRDFGARKGKSAARVVGHVVGVAGLVPVVLSAVFRWSASPCEYTGWRQLQWWLYT